jgi:hypothetical protein
VLHNPRFALKLTPGPEDVYNYFKPGLGPGRGGEGGVADGGAQMASSASQGTPPAGDTMPDGAFADGSSGVCLVDGVCAFEAGLGVGRCQKHHGYPPAVQLWSPAGAATALGHAARMLPQDMEVDSYTLGVQVPHPSRIPASHPPRAAP